MTMTTTQTQAGRGRFSTLFDGLFTDISTRLDMHRRRRAVYTRTREELIALSDRDLADIGIHRRNINVVAREAAEMVGSDA